MATGYKFKNLIGGDSDCLDSRNGALLEVGDIAIVTDGDNRWDFEVVTSTAAEDSPNIIVPDLNASNKRWKLLTYPIESLPPSFEASILPDYTAAEAGKAVIVSSTGTLEWGEAGGGLKWSVSDVNVTTTKGNGVLMDTSDAVKTVTLHTSPEAGNTVAVGDLNGTFDVFNCTVLRNGMKIQGLEEDLILDVKNQRVTLVYTGIDSNWIITELEPNGSQYEYMPYAVMHVQDQKPSGTSGGTSIAGTQTRVLNSTLKNDIVGASLSANQVTLPPGDYYIAARAIAYYSNGHKLRIYSVTGSTYIAEGESCNAGAGITYAALGAPLSLSVTTVIELRHHTVSAKATDGLGYPISQGTEVYADLKITKIGNNYAPKPIISSARTQTIPNLDTTGGIEGFDITKTGANQLTITKGTCLDATKTVALALTSDTALAIPAVANTIYHIFVVRLLDGNYGVKAYTSEAAAASDGTINAFRWIGFWKTNGSANCVEGLLSGDCFAYLKPSESVFSSGFTSAVWASLNLTSVVPVSRISEVYIGITTATINNASVFLSINGATVICVAQGYPTNMADSGQVWNFSEYGGSARQIPIKDGVVYAFINSSASANLGVAQVKLRR